MSKICTKCGIEKELNQFHKRSAMSDGHKSECKECTSFYQKQKYDSGEIRSAIYMRQYGITVEEYDQMVEEQNGRCKICGTDEPGGNRKRFSIDHNHKTGEVRGLLCNPCNAALGLFKDNPTILQSALTYLSTNGHYGTT
jgi:hypothetical protein